MYQAKGLLKCVVLITTTKKMTTCKLCSTRVSTAWLQYHKIIVSSEWGAKSPIFCHVSLRVHCHLFDELLGGGSSRNCSASPYVKVKCMSFSGPRWNLHRFTQTSTDQPSPRPPSFHNYKLLYQWKSPPSNKPPCVIRISVPFWLCFD